MKILIILLGLFILNPNRAYAEYTCEEINPVIEHSLVLPIPTHQSDEDTLLWLSRAFVSEAGFDATKDYATFAWILARKWQERNVKDPTWSFKQQILAYCTGFKHKMRNLPKQRWVQHLPEDGVTKPLGWSHKASWTLHQQLWLDVRVFAKAWSLGQILDPCAGKATDWTSTKIKVNMEIFSVVNCGNTRNRYYRVRKS